MGLLSQSWRHKNQIQQAESDNIQHKNQTQQAESDNIQHKNQIQQAESDNIHHKNQIKEVRWFPMSGTCDPCQRPNSPCWGPVPHVRDCYEYNTQKLTAKM